MSETDSSLRQRIQYEARVAGLRRAATPSLRHVERRRLELWGIGLLVIVAIAAGLALLPLLSRLTGIDSLVPAPVVQGALVAICLGFAAYAVEKELHLRRLSRLLGDERVVNVALSDRVREFSALVEVGKAVNSVLGLQDVLDIILSSALTLLGGSGGSVMLMDPEGRLRVVSSEGPEQAHGTPEQVLDRALSGGLGSSGHPGADGFPDLPPDWRPAAHTSLSVPLVNRGELLGALSLTASPGSPFTPHEARVLNVFAEQAAISIANARLYEGERDRATEQLEVSQLKSQLLTAVSHELKPALGAILESASVLRDEDTPGERDGLIGVIERQGGRALRLVDRLLETARQGPRSAASAQPVDLASIARTVAGQSESGGRRIDVVAPSSCLVHGDAEAIRRVLACLVDNAYRHGGPPVEVEVAMEGDQAVLTVSDSGPGIPEVDRERIFGGLDEDDTDAGPERRSLAIVRAIVAALRGRVWVEDASRGGAAFRVSLPAFRSSAAAS